jgi:toxin ParE1/3/4
MKPVQVHRDAEAETDSAFEWYWTQSESAALGFESELEIAINTLRESPKACAPYLEGTRRVMLHRYPYYIVFREFPGKIQILAVAHAKRRPGYWQERI